MPTLKQVKQQIQHLDNYSKVLGFREIRELPKILLEDEVIETAKGLEEVVSYARRRLSEADGPEERRERP